MIEYVFDENTIVLGELQKSHWLNANILVAKKTIFNAKIDMSLPNIHCIKNGVKVLFNYERLKYTLRGREDIFEKRWGMMIYYYDEQQV